MCKIVVHAVYSSHMGIKKSLGVRSGLYGEWLIISIFWMFKKLFVCYELCELALSLWRMMRRFESFFLISTKTSGKQMLVYHEELTVLQSSKDTVATCLDFLTKQATICLEVLRARMTFVDFRLSWKTHTEDCCLFSGSYA